MSDKLPEENRPDGMMESIRIPLSTATELYQSEYTEEYRRIYDALAEPTLWQRFVRFTRAYFAH